jgi:hypothetical protein
MPISAGTCTTVAVSVLLLAALPELVWTGSPPPHAVAVFDTEVGEFRGTSTVRLIVELLPPGIAVVELQATEPSSVQAHALPVEVYEFSV